MPPAFLTLSLRGQELGTQFKPMKKPALVAGTFIGAILPVIFTRNQRRDCEMEDTLSRSISRVFTKQVRAGSHTPSFIGSIIGSRVIMKTND